MGEVEEREALDVTGRLMGWGKWLGKHMALSDRKAGERMWVQVGMQKQGSLLRAPATRGVVHVDTKEGEEVDVWER